MILNEVTAENVRKIQSAKKTVELETVLEMIMKVAKGTDNRLFIDYPFKFSETVEGLEARGFNVEHCNSICSQRDEIYYIISW